MKKILFILVLFVTSFSFGQKVNPIWCTAGNNQPGIESLTNKSSINKILTNARLIDPNGVIIIPVVFHVLYDPNKPEQNISQATIITQLERLNTDIRKLNTDIGLLPPVWQPLAADLKFEFRLACIDPNGLSTNGIIPKTIPVGYEFCDVGQGPIICGDVKLSALNGNDAWPTDTYLNVWVCDMGNSALFGLATFPWERFGPDVTFTIGGNPVSIPRTALDGIMLDYRVVGDPSPNTNHNKGRVLTHEVGHWLGLFHIFQRGFNGNGQACFPPGDFVDDTPPQFLPTFACSSFPLNDPCSPAPGDGIMFMNYMDVTQQDECRYFFTTGQKDRARSYFSQTGPLGTRYPYIQNYFGIKHFIANPHIVQNNLITVPFNNPACLPVTFSYTGPVSVFSQDDQRVIFSVPCGINGAISLTITSGNYTDDYLFDFENPGGCYWPKAYGNVDGDAFLMKDNQGNIMAMASGILTNSTFYNHVGLYPPPSQPYTRTIQYTNSGVTNWLDADYRPVFSFQSGVVLMTSGQYIDGTTGNAATPPINLSPNEVIVAQTINGSIVTQINNILKVYSGTTPTTIDIGTNNWYGLKYNRTTDDLIIGGYTNFTSNFFKILHFNGTSFQEIYSNTYAGLPHQVDYIDNNNQCYFINVGITNTLMNWNYINNTTSAVNIPGFLNGNLLYPSVTINRYTDNIVIVYNEVSEFIYALDLSNLTSKKITTTNFSRPLNYEIDGNDLYISSNNNGSVHIGSQIIPSVNQSTDRFFIAKLQLTDFQPFQRITNGEAKLTENSSSFKVLVLPNPITGNNLNIKIEEINKPSLSTYSINITNRVGRMVLQKTNYLPGSPLNVGNLEKGIYYVEIINRKEERVTKSFVKL